MRWKQRKLKGQQPPGIEPCQCSGTAWAIPHNSLYVLHLYFCLMIYYVYRGSAHLCAVTACLWLMDLRPPVSCPILPSLISLKAHGHDSDTLSLPTVCVLVKSTQLQLGAVQFMCSMKTLKTRQQKPPWWNLVSKTGCTLHCNFVFILTAKVTVTYIVDTTKQVKYNSTYKAVVAFAIINDDLTSVMSNFAS